MLHKNSQENTKNRSPNRSQNSVKKKLIGFDESAIRSLSHQGTNRTIYWFKGYENFGIRVAKNGSKTFIYLYHHLNRRRWMTIGKYPKTSLAQALKEYAQSIEKHQKGSDPALEKKEENIEFRETPTVKQVVERYVEFSIKTGKKSWKKEARYLERNAVPFIGWYKIDKVKRRDIAMLVNKVIYERGSKHSACELLQYLKRLYNVAISWGFCEHNPCYHIQKPAKTTKRDRILLPDEIYRFWTRLDDANIVPIVQLALKFTLLTMARKSEVRFCEWQHINISSKTWTIPSTHSKNGRSHVIPLSEPALKIISEAYQYTGQSKFVFGSTRLPKDAEIKPKDLKPLNKTAMSHALRKNMGLFDVVENFTVHDLRRTGATLITSLGCPRYWATLLLNHTDNSVTGIYDRYAYDWEKQCGMEVLGHTIKRIAETSCEELVPSLSLLRHEIEQKGILRFRYKPMNDEQVTQVVDMRTDHQAISLAPVSYSLSYDQGLLSA